MGLFRRTKSKTEKILEGAEKRAVALSEAQSELQLQKERAAVFKIRDRARKVRERAEKLRRGSGGGGFWNPGSMDDMLQRMGTPPESKKKKVNYFKM